MTKLKNKLHYLWFIFPIIVGLCVYRLGIAMGLGAFSLFPTSAACVGATVLIMAKLDEEKHDKT